MATVRCRSVIGTLLCNQLHSDLGFPSLTSFCSNFFARYSGVRFANRVLPPPFDVETTKIIPARCCRKLSFRSLMPPHCCSNAHLINMQRQAKDAVRQKRISC